MDSATCGQLVLDYIRKENGQAVLNRPEEQARKQYSSMVSVSVPAFKFLPEFRP